ncbi:endonuclease-reverse transcriptase [Trichonephila clavipes]|nr:endonuclease-reverse transcriptase [Trichonephila clavipes]
MHLFFILLCFEISKINCPVDPVIFPRFLQVGGALESSYEAFRFTESYGVIFQCNVKYCVGKCEPAICGDYLSLAREESWGRKRRSISDNAGPLEDEMTLSKEILVLDFGDEEFHLAETHPSFCQCETWTLNLETIRALETFERKALRTIFGHVKDQGCWRTRYNFELYRLYKEPQVTQVIRSNRLRWLGHIWRSPENNQIRTYTFKNPMGSRTRGRPPTRWRDDVENDLKTLYIKNWQRAAAYRWNWRKRAVEAAKTCNRLLRL